MKSYDISGLNILVLENHVLIRKLLTDVFKEFGVPTVYSTADKETAWKIFNTMPVDVILCDWCNDLNGMEFLHYVRDTDSSPNPYVCFFMVTAYTEIEKVCMARDEGMTEYLAKPVSPKMIYSRIVRVIEHERLFVRAPEFFGPDRRRKAMGEVQFNERRSAA